MSQLKKTIKHSAIYGIGTVLRQLTGLVMLPIYTRYLTPADYGVVELLTMTVTFVSIFIGLRISQAMFRFYVLADTEQEKKQLVSTVMLTIMVSGSFGAFALYLAAAPAAKILFGAADYIYEVQLFSITILLGAVVNISLSYLRARQKPVLFVLIGAITLVLQVSLNVLFVVVMDLHVRGVVYSVLVSSSIMASGLTIYVFWHVGVSYSIAVAKRLIKFIAPLMLASIALFYVSSGDRYFLRVFGNLEDVGLYALAWRISSILVTLFEAFQMSWFADQFEVVKKDNAREIYNQIFRVLVAVLFLMGAGIALFVTDFFRIMVSPEFYAASDAVPIIIFAIFFQVLTQFCSFGILYKEKTRHIAEAGWIKAIIATVGYYLLIPVLGAVGAATAALLALMVEFFWTYIKAKALYDMGLIWKPINLLGLITIVGVFTGFLLPAGEIIFFIARIMIFSIMLYLFYKLPNWSESEKALISGSLEKITSTFKMR